MHCECGCGGVTSVAPCSNKKRGYVRGKHVRFIRGHNQTSKMVGKRHSLETRLAMSEQRKGDQHWNWQGGVSADHDNARKTFEYRQWRTLVFARDNYTCQHCGATGYVHAHHIESFAKHPDLRTVLENGITLCESCHLLTRVAA